MTVPQLKPLEGVAASGFEKRERVQLAIAGGAVDRPPVCFWRHFAPGQSGGNMAIDTVNFYARLYDLDIAKIMSDIPYPMPRLAIRQPEEWAMVVEWEEVGNTFISSYAAAVRQARALLGPAYPLLVTVYSPATWALLFTDTYTRREVFLEHLATKPALVHTAMGNIALNLRRLATACIEAGADGIFLSCHACDPSLPREIYNEIARPYDLMVLQGAKDGWLNLLHAHSDDPQIRVEDYLSFPINGLSWADIKSGRSIASVRAQTGMCLMGGWDRTSPLLTDGSAPFDAILDLWVSDARSAVAQSPGGGLILAPGCSLPASSTHNALSAYRLAVDKL